MSWQRTESCHDLQSPSNATCNLSHPGGMAENSPAFQRWDNHESASRPEGTAESAARGTGEKQCLNRPFGTYSFRTLKPSVETLGYCRLSLRDRRNSTPSL